MIPKHPDGLCSAAGFTAGGLHLGRVLANASRMGHRAALAGGVVLIGIGVRILHDHGVFG
jgi:putative Mn2+ efflux pump MntP